MLRRLGNKCVKLLEKWGLYDPAGFDAGTGFIVALGEPLDSILRVLDEKYFQARLTQAKQVLRDLGVKPSLTLGCSHPGYTNAGVLGSRRADREPHAYFGWVGKDATGVLEEEGGPAESAWDAFFDEGLLLGAFSLRGYSFRATYLRTTTVLQVFHEFCTGEGTDWAPENLLEADYPSASPLRRMAEAYLAGDDAGRQEADTEARTLYSAAGYRLFGAGFRALDKCQGR